MYVSIPIFEQLSLLVSFYDGWFLTPPSSVAVQNSYKHLSPLTWSKKHIVQTSSFLTLPGPKIDSDIL